MFLSMKVEPDFSPQHVMPANLVDSPDGEYSSALVNITSCEKGNVVRSVQEIQEVRTGLF